MAPLAPAVNSRYTKSVSEDEKKRGPGRPALGNAVMQMVRLPATMIAEIDAVREPRESRAALIRAAIEREIARRRG